jgi:hypothetical protein
MSFDTIAFNNAPGAQKSLLVTLNSVLSMTAQFTFTEYPNPTGGGRWYDHYIVTSGATEFVQVYLEDTGFLAVATGINNAGDSYSGAWTPNNGTHKVDISISAANVPTLLIDNVSIPLTFITSGAGLIGGFPTNCVAVFSTAAGLPGPTSSSLSNFFVTAGILPNTTVYCCS